MSKIKVIDQSGISHILDAVEGWRVMEIIREHGFEVGGLCGHPANDDEEAMLDNVPILSNGSRLSCQIIFTPELDGLEVKLVANG